MNVEKHLFIIWGSALYKSEEIISDIKKHFDILAVIETHWSKKLFATNLSRFYGQKLADRSAKIKQCKTDPFLVVVVNDNNPTYAQRATSAGSEKVNSNMFDAKDRYRKWTGGGHRIHGSNSEKESTKDLFLLFGDKLEQLLLNGPEVRQTYKEDLFGSGGFTGIKEVFELLNHCLNYIVLRNFEGFPDQACLSSHGDIDFLTDKHKEMAFILNAKKVYKKPYRVHYTIMIDNKEIPCDIRFVGDGYMDSSWQKDLLVRRTKAKSGYFRPDNQDYFYSLLYHALIHKRSFSNEYKERLVELALEMNLEFNPERAFEHLKEFMQKFNYNFTEPTDLTVYYNPEYCAANTHSVKRILHDQKGFLVKKIKSLVNG